MEFLFCSSASRPVHSIRLLLQTCPINFNDDRKGKKRARQQTRPAIVAGGRASGSGQSSGANLSSLSPTSAESRRAIRTDNSCSPPRSPSGTDAPSAGDDGEPAVATGRENRLRARSRQAASARPRLRIALAYTPLPPVLDLSAGSPREVIDIDLEDSPVPPSLPSRLSDHFTNISTPMGSVGTHDDNDLSTSPETSLQQEVVVADDNEDDGVDAAAAAAGLGGAGGLRGISGATSGSASAFDRGNLRTWRRLGSPGSSAGIGGVSSTPRPYSGSDGRLQQPFAGRMRATTAAVVGGEERDGSDDANGEGEGSTIGAVRSRQQRRDRREQRRHELNAADSDSETVGSTRGRRRMRLQSGDDGERLADRIQQRESRLQEERDMEMARRLQSEEDERLYQGAAQAMSLGFMTGTDGSRGGGGSSSGDADGGGGQWPFGGDYTSVDDEYAWAEVDESEEEDSEGIDIAVGGQNDDAIDSSGDNVARGDANRRNGQGNSSGSSSSLVSGSRSVDSGAVIDSSSSTNNRLATRLRTRGNARNAATAADAITVSGNAESDDEVIPVFGGVDGIDSDAAAGGAGEPQQPALSQRTRRRRGRGGSSSRASSAPLAGPRSLQASVADVSQQRGRGNANSSSSGSSASGGRTARASRVGVGRGAYGHIGAGGRGGVAGRVSAAALVGRGGGSSRGIGRRSAAADARRRRQRSRDNRGAGSSSSSGGVGWGAGMDDYAQFVSSLLGQALGGLGAGLEVLGGGRRVGGGRGGGGGHGHRNAAHTALMNRNLTPADYQQLLALGELALLSSYCCDVMRARCGVLPFPGTLPFLLFFLVDGGRIFAMMILLHCTWEQ